jgi:protein TonB
MGISEDVVDTGAAADDPVNGDIGGIIGDDTAVTAERALSERPALIAAYTRRNFEFIQRRIREKLAYPPRARRTGVQGRAEVIFTIRLDGSVSDVWIRISSGQDILDKAIVDAVYAAAPFPPPPVQAKIAAPVSFRLR